MSARKPTAREYAAVVFALAEARGALSSLEQLQLGNMEPEEFSDQVTRILKGTSFTTIAKALGLKETDMALDWTEVLTEAEMHLIRGGRMPSRSMTANDPKRTQIGTSDDMTTDLDIDVRIFAQRALLGNVPSSLRAVSVEIRGTELHFRAIFDRGASSQDKELLSVAATELIADFPLPPFDISEEYLDSPAPMEMAHLKHLVYLRSEP